MCARTAARRRCFARSQMLARLLIYIFTAHPYLHGTSPPPLAPTFDIIIDNVSEHRSQNSYVSPGSAGQRYTSPLLPSGTHSLSAGNIYGASIDYTIVQAGEKGPLVSYAVDEDGTVHVGEGAGWTRREAQFIATDDPKMGGTRRRRQTLWVRAQGFCLPTYAISPSSPEYTSGTLQRENTLLFLNDSLAPGDHTLTLEVATAVNISLVLDYFVYEAAFVSVGVMPNLTAEAPMTTSSSSVGSSSSSASSSSSSGGSMETMGGQGGARPGPTSVEPYMLATPSTGQSRSTPVTIREKLSMSVSNHSSHRLTSTSPPSPHRGDTEGGGPLESTPGVHIAHPSHFTVSNPEMRSPLLHSHAPLHQEENGRGARAVEKSEDVEVEVEECLERDACRGCKSSYWNRTARTWRAVTGRRRWRS
ncbi:hypothetical protein Hypma_000069 [Hypsizygus marmoreus]|uniref:Uncharacterized protein n=1 Tax=Hypsizygus marmoreus TaxID=39966 RepID=A0A369KB39_HYPMA|nr:hypothetical protein Hypma_000069 [Hypsizygus marmoreus]